MLDSFKTEFNRYKTIAEKTLEQVPDEALNAILVPDGNSLAMLVRHLTGNFRSRFTSFLTSDGEKPWRDRDAEFEERAYSREEVDEMWQEGWRAVNEALDGLTDADLERTVRIRGQELTVHDALSRSVSHLAYHVGQMVLIGRSIRQRDWAWISIPKGQSKTYNLNPTKEKNPG